ncbi:MAG: redoxin domain-containing protein [Saprospiraceae bacterium]|nr:redoxin domain-containing protein [Saprospiraceae bacterium]
MSVSVGDKAPSFSLKAHDKSDVSLSDYSGKNVVLLFFPLAFTGTCTDELCAIRDDLSAYNSLNAEVLAISVDSLFTLDQFRQKHGYNFKLLSDFNRDTSRAYGAFYEEFVLGMKGVSKRAAFVIDATGTIRYAEVLEKASDLPNFESVKSTLSSLSA